MASARQCTQLIKPLGIALTLLVLGSVPAGENEKKKKKKNGGVFG
ncbi:hypothetical protein EYF80_066836 [Liparis tanakae]|uniref:Uncharacterized protein n=1 Tax=Liparis tanakae TaxID=230148 RepID=A0A4Z2E2S5_9TELE|nr:hypothetical protein EYF80_066836 [Liparis tanakae]